MAEAAAQLQKGLDQLALLPDTHERQRQELEFWCALGAVLLTLKGNPAPEAGRAYAHARKLWEQLGSPLESLHIPYGQWRYHLNCGELDLALRLAEDVLHLSRQRNDSAGLVLGHTSFARNMMLAGEFALSRSHYEDVLALYDPVSHRSLVHQAVIYPHLESRAYLGFVLFCLGFPDQASSQSSAAIAEARRSAHPPSLAAIVAVGAGLHSFSGNDAALSERADELTAVTTDRGFALSDALRVLFCGWVKVRRGDVAEGISLLRSGLSAYRATRAVYVVPLFITLLARACKIAGQVEEAAILLDEALQIADRTGERWFAAELYRHKGQLLLRRGHAEAAEELYRKALGIAREQEAKLWELRAAVSLARLWRDQGRRAAARDLLTPVYGWFTEGFGTPDLKESKALLVELG
jgi:predicted ATPase